MQTPCTPFAALDCEFGAAKRAKQAGWDVLSWVGGGLAGWLADKLAECRKGSNKAEERGGKARGFEK